MLVPAAARSKAYVRSRTACWDCEFESRRLHSRACVCCECRSLRRTDPSPRGILPSVLWLAVCEITEPQQPGGLDPSTAMMPQKKKVLTECDV
jgi:hypothetical protein